jgi:hypothetical protein
MAKSSSSPSAIQYCHSTKERTPIQTTKEDQRISPAFSDKRIVRLCYWAWLNIQLDLRCLREAHIIGSGQRGHKEGIRVVSDHLLLSVTPVLLIGKIKVVDLNEFNHTPEAIDLSSFPALISKSYTCATKRQNR